MTFELAHYRGAITMTWRLETGNHKNLYVSPDAAFHVVHLIKIRFFIGHRQAHQNTSNLSICKNQLEMQNG